MIQWQQWAKIRVDQCLNWMWNRDVAECISRRMHETKRNRWECGSVGIQASAPTSPHPHGPWCNLYISSAYKGDARRSQQALTELTCPSHKCNCKGSPLLDRLYKRDGMLEALHSSSRCMLNDLTIWFVNCQRECKSFEYKIYLNFALMSIIQRHLYWIKNILK